MRVVPLVDALTKISELHEPLFLYASCPGESCDLPDEEHAEGNDGSLLHMSHLDMVVCSSCEQGGESVEYPCPTAEAMGIETVEDHGSFVPGGDPEEEFHFAEYYSVGESRHDTFLSAVRFQREHAPGSAVVSHYRNRDSVLCSRPVW